MHNIYPKSYKTDRYFLTQKEGREDGRTQSNCNKPVPLRGASLKMSQKLKEIRQYDENKRGRVLQESSFQRCIQSASLRQDAQIMILDARNSSESVNVDAQMVLLDAQNRSIGVQLVGSWSAKFVASGPHYPIQGVR